MVQPAVATDCPSDAALLGCGVLILWNRLKNKRPKRPNGRSFLYDRKSTGGWTKLSSITPTPKDPQMFSRTFRTGFRKSLLRPAAAGLYRLRHPFGLLIPLRVTTDTFCGNRLKKKRPKRPGKGILMSVLSNCILIILGRRFFSKLKKFS